MEIAKLFKVLDRIKIDVSQPSGCWEWAGYKDKKGYGYMGWSGTDDGKLAHCRAAYRLTYQHWRGEIIHELDHLCKNKGCVNPWHLEDVSHAVNMRRHFCHLDDNICVNGHELTPEYVRPYTNANEKPRATPLMLCRECGREDTRRRRRERKIRGVDNAC